jgi:hypothetical protein
MRAGCDTGQVRWCPAARHKGPNPLSSADFSTDPGKPDGLSSWCRACMNAASRDRRASDPGRRRAAWRRYRATLRALQPRW